MFSLLKIPIVCIMCVYLMCGSGCIGFMDTTLAIYLDKQVKNKSPAVSRVSRPYSWCTLATCVHNCPSNVSSMLLPAPEM